MMRHAGRTFLVLVLVLSLFAPSFADFITGTFGSEALNGTAIGDFIQGLQGNDTLRGFDGPDLLDGGPGNDVLVGGKGSDSMFDFEGSNTFRINPGDVDAFGFESIAGQGKVYFNFPLGGRAFQTPFGVIVRDFNEGIYSVGGFFGPAVTEKGEDEFPFEIFERTSFGMIRKVNIETLPFEEEFFPFPGPFIE